MRGLEILREADAIVREESKAPGGRGRVAYRDSSHDAKRWRSHGGWFAGAVYSHVAVRAVKSEDAMTAEWARLPDVLDAI